MVTGRSTYGWLLVVAQFLLIAYLIMLVVASGVPKSMLVLGIGLMLIIDGLSLFAFTMLANRPGNWSVHPAPKRDAQFITDGPYRWIRHPMYAAVLIVGLGAIVLAGSVNAGVAGCALAIVLVEKIRIEEKLMAQHHTDWPDYQSRTARLIPQVW